MIASYEGLEFTRPGHATVRIETDDGRVVYIDPWSKAIDDTPHDADLVFVTHEHFDHYDPDAIAAVSVDETTVVTFDEINTSELSQEVVSLESDQELEIGDVLVRSVPAYNNPEGQHVKPNGEPYHPEGTVIGLLVRIDGYTVYYASDTDALPELSAIEADVVIPPIGGRPTMDRHEAARLVEDINPSLVLPVHYNSELIKDIDADVDAFKEEVEEMGIQVTVF